MRFLSSCQYTHGCYAPASWAARHTTVCLDYGTLIGKRVGSEMGFLNFRSGTFLRTEARDLTRIQTYLPSLYTRQSSN